MTLSRRFAGIAILFAVTQAWGTEPGATALRFEVSLARELHDSPQNGRLLVVLDPGTRGEPRFSLGRTGLNVPPVLGRDVQQFQARDTPLVVDRAAAIFPIADLDHLPSGDYSAQAVLIRSEDILAPDAPGNLISPVRRVHLDPANGTTIPLELSKEIGPEIIPVGTEFLRFLKIPSPLLSAFHKRPMFVRAGVILPRDFDREPDRRYPLRVHIGGYGSRFTEVGKMMAIGSPFRDAWLAPDAPPMILLHLDGAGPLGDPNQVDSDNHGPYGASLTQELIPHVEHLFRGQADGRSRFLDGCSTGGWVSLALQVFYPDFFNGAWSSSPDPVDFRKLELINVYADRNAYVNARGFERPAQRTLDGDVTFTVRHECQLENVLGLGDSYTRSGGQWGSWNATFGPRSPDGLPMPLWDARTGAIDRVVAKHWKRYDLRQVLEANWATLGPKLRGKLHIHAGDADDYFLNNAIHLLDAFLKRADPPADAEVVFGAGQGHCALMLSEPELLNRMAEAAGR